MIGTAAAVLGAGLLGAGASIFGANKAASAQEKAAAQAAQAQQQALEYQKANYAQASQNLSPFINTGTGASNLLANFYGLNGNPALGQNALNAYYNSPDYKFALKGGQEALDNSLAAKGGALGGNAIKASTEYGQGMATQNLQNYLTRLGVLSGQGIQAGGYLGSIGTGAGNSVGSTTNNLGNTYMAQGTAEASGILGGVKGFQSALSPLLQFNQLSQSSFKPNTGLSLTNTGGLY